MNKQSPLLELMISSMGTKLLNETMLVMVCVKQMMSVVANSLPNQLLTSRLTVYLLSLSLP